MVEEKTETQTAHTYYSESRKKTFLYSRLLVGLSMFFLLLGLGTNIFLFNTQQRNTLQSRASTDTLQALPELPENCMYETKNKRTILICATPVPQTTTQKNDVQYPLAITLPKLPPQCTYQSTDTGYKVACDPFQTIIPIVDVALPAECKPSTDPNEMTVECTKSTNEKVTSALPTLPQGCSYTKTDTSIRIVCNAAQ